MVVPTGIEDFYKALQEMQVPVKGDAQFLMRFYTTISLSLILVKYWGLPQGLPGKIFSIRYRK